MHLTFMGAARTVTGSKHLLDTGAHKVLVDCGLFQGLKDLRQRNWEALPVRATEITSLVLTHAHLDHCGYIPRLVAQGFKGRVFCTPATAELTRVVLMDAAHLQEEDAERANRKGYTRHQPALPLFTEKDAARALELLQPVGYERPMPVAPGVTAEFLDAGHLLGSSYARVFVEQSNKTILFGGDLGRYGRPVLPDPTPVTAADYLLVESTYGNRIHEQDDDGARIAQIIRETADRGGKVVIPAFALGRVEELLYWIDRLEERRQIPVLPVYVDSPMAATVLAEYRKRMNELDPEIAAMATPGSGHVAAERKLCAFCTSKLTVVSTIAESRAVQESNTPSIVISASGMATGGRVLHHLTRALPNPRNTVLFAGYQAAGTRGRQLKDGAKFTKIHGVEVQVAARIEGIDSMSAHADATEIMRWLGHFKTPPKTTFLVHGEVEPMDALRARIEKELGWRVRTPGHLERVEIA
ncbi:MAG TPA: MBL fold metallo-hydrolase [Vicinamibacterales bacterium]|nr:MBL fold metallo-hydrolase [Vicinamibacterales bacterium]